jgi:hypothetical protein
VDPGALAQWYKDRALNDVSTSLDGIGEISAIITIMACAQQTVPTTLATGCECLANNSMIMNEGAYL